MRSRQALAIDLVAGLAWLVVGFAVMVLVAAPLQSGMAPDDPRRAEVGAWAAVAGLVVAGIGIFVTFRLVSRWAASGPRPAGFGPARGGVPMPRPNTLRQGVVQGGWTKPATRPDAARRMPSAAGAPPSRYAAPNRLASPTRSASPFAPSRPLSPASPFAGSATPPAGSGRRSRAARAGAMLLALAAGLLLIGAFAEGSSVDPWLPLPLLVLAGMLFAAGGPELRGERLALRGAAMFVAPMLFGFVGDPSAAGAVLFAMAVLFVGAVVVIGTGHALGRGLAGLLAR